MSLVRFALVIPFGLSLLGAVACSDPPPLIPRGAWFVAFQGGGLGCAIGSHNAQMGELSPGADPGYIADGENEVQVECEVQSQGGAFAVTGRVAGGGQSLRVEVRSITEEATFDNPTPGFVSFRSQNTQAVFNSTTDVPCNFFLIDGDYVRAGSTRLSFQCPSIVSGENTCGVAQGYVAFDRCFGTPGND